MTTQSWTNLGQISGHRALPPRSWDIAGRPGVRQYHLVSVRDYYDSLPRDCWRLLRLPAEPAAQI